MPLLHLQVYYHNPSTGESSWQKPERFEGNAGSAGAAPIPISSEQIPNTGWSEVTCADGRKYFYHAGKQVHDLTAHVTIDVTTAPDQHALYLSILSNWVQRGVGKHMSIVSIHVAPVWSPWHKRPRLLHGCVTQAAGAARIVVITKFTGGYALKSDAVCCRRRLGASLLR